MKRDAWKSVMLAGLCLLAAFAAAPAQAQKSFPPAIAELLPAAKKEGTVTVYGQSLNPEQIQTINKALNAFYGFDSDLKIISGLHPQKAAELVQGARMGAKSGIDVFWTASEVAMTMDKAGILMPFAWTKAWGLPAEMSLGENGLRSYDGTLAFVIYNTDLVKTAEAPRTYKDLLNPKWKGRIAIPRAPTSFMYMSYATGEPEAAEIAKGLMGPQDAKILPRFPDVRARVISGEFALGLGIDAFVEIRRGAPVQTAPIDPVVLSPWAFYIMKDSEHPALAKLWGWFGIAPEGQKVLEEVRAISIVSSKDSDIAKFSAGKKVVVVPHDFIEKEGAARNARFADIMGIK
jgi:iron(III) transport system substrate-binding protein